MEVYCKVATQQNIKTKETEEGDGTRVGTKAKGRRTLTRTFKGDPKYGAARTIAVGRQLM